MLDCCSLIMYFCDISEAVISNLYVNNIKYYYGTCKII